MKTITITIKNLTMQDIQNVAIILLTLGLLASIGWILKRTGLTKEEKKEVWMEEYWRAKCEKNKKVFINSCGKLVQMDDHEAHIGGN